MDNYQQLIEFINTLKLDDADKQDLISKLSDQNLSAEDKNKIISDFVKQKNQQIDEDLAIQIDPLSAKAEAELEAAEQEYDAEMAVIDGENEAVIKEMDDQMNQV